MVERPALTSVVRSSHLLIRAVKRYPLLTVLAIVLGGYFIFATFFLVSRLLVDPDHVVVTAFEAEGENDDDRVALTINRVTYHPATKVRGLFMRQSKSTARPEYIQVDGTIALNADSTGVTALVGSAYIQVESGGGVEHDLRTRGNPCWSSGWPPMALQLKTKPSDFTIRIPVRDDPAATMLLAHIRNGTMPPVTFTGIYSSVQECESIEVMLATTPHEITVDPISLGPGAVQDFYPYGVPRFTDPGGPKREYWIEWARGWVPGEF